MWQVPWNALRSVIPPWHERSFLLAAARHYQQFRHSSLAWEIFPFGCRKTISAVPSFLPGMRDLSLWPLQDNISSSVIPPWHERTFPLAAARQYRIFTVFRNYCLKLINKLYFINEECRLFNQIKLLVHCKLFLAVILSIKILRG